jgi:hypothetical protein
MQQFRAWWPRPAIYWEKSFHHLPGDLPNVLYSVGKKISQNGVRRCIHLDGPCHRASDRQ